MGRVWRAKRGRGACVSDLRVERARTVVRVFAARRAWRGRRGVGARATASRAVKRCDVSHSVLCVVRVFVLTLLAVCAP